MTFDFSSNEKLGLFVQNMILNFDAILQKQSTMKFIERFVS